MRTPTSRRLRPASRSTSPRTSSSRKGARDCGTTLVEILIAIVLVGGVVAGTMATLRASTIAGTLHRDHSNGHAWLQTASDILYAAPKVGCASGEVNVRAAYNAVVDAVPHPQDWEQWQIRVLQPVKFWNAANLDADPDVEYFFGNDCDPSLNLQLVEIEVRNIDGRIIETVEIVK